MKTNHEYIGKYPINPDSEKLILGTIHPHTTDKFDIPFFYGNRSTIWKILNSAFDNEIGDSVTLDGVLKFLTKRKIAISDTVVSCTRKNPTALDSDLIPETLNHGLVEQIRMSNINEILFTSAFQKNNAFKLFYVDILGLKITEDIKRDKQVFLNSNVFGRPVLLTILISPSGAANIALSKSAAYIKVKSNYETLETPVQQFKIDFYRKKFN